MPPCGRELLVAVHNISKSYGRATAVAGVTLTLWAGEICGFVGANGAGKTTALRMLAGILKPDSGGGHILGFGLQREAAEIRERVGYMSQRLSLYGELSVFENLRFRAAVYGLRNPRAAAEAALRDFNLVLVKEFCRAFSNALGANLHVQLVYGEEPHHVAEAIFKCLARALDIATQIEARAADLLPSTKGRI